MFVIWIMMNWYKILLQFIGAGLLHNKITTKLCKRNIEQIILSANKTHISRENI